MFQIKCKHCTHGCFVFEKVRCTLIWNNIKQSFHCFKMKYMFVVVFSISLIHIQTENINVYPGKENIYSIFPGDTIALQCPVNYSKKSPVYWSYMTGNTENIISIGDKIDEKTHYQFRIELGFKHLKNVTFLTIYNITSKDQKMFKCYFYIEGSNQSLLNIEYKYNILLANITQSLIKKPNGEVCCVLQGKNIRSIKFIWEQRTLYNEHVRFIESVQKNDSGTAERNTDETMRKHNHSMSCLDLNTNGISKYEKEGKYICSAQVFLHGRNQTVIKTTSIKIDNIQDRPFCVQDTRNQLAIIGDDIVITMQFYSKPTYSALTFSKNDSQLKLGDEIVNIKNISLDVYNVTVKVSGYEIIISITEFSEEDIGNYTVNIINEFGSCNCTVQLVSQGNYTKKVVIGNKTRAEITKSLLWYILACGSIIVVLFAMLALRSTFIKTVDACSKPTIRKPSCHKSTEKKATKKQAAKKPRRAYSDQFMEVTLNQRNNGERILIIGQTNEMDASTETNI